MFAQSLQLPARRWSPLACSLALHGAAIASLFYYFDAVPRTVRALEARYSFRLIRFNTPLLPYKPPPSRATQGDGRKIRPAPAAPMLSPAETGGGAPSPEQPNVVARRMFQLPDLPKRNTSAQILIQPDSPPNLSLPSDLRVPELLIWKPHVPARPAPKKFVAQQRPQEPVRPKALSSPPVLQSPNNAPQMADLALAPQAVVPAPMLPRPPATTAPIRTASAGNDQVPQIGGGQSNGDDSPNILSIPDMPVPALGAFQVPAGNQGVASGTGNGDAGHAGGGNGKSNGGVGQGSGQSNGQGTSGTSASSLGSGGPSGDMASSGARGGSPGHGFGIMAGNGGAGAPGFTAGLNVTRVVLPPEGHFAVLVQSSGSEAFPESEGVLTGKIVYTAYVRTGAKKEWLLQYCLPRAVEQKAAASGRIPPLEPPFPFLMLRPDLTFGPDIDYLIVHGFVTSAGKFEQLKYVIAPAEKAEKDLLLSSLDGWRLRPGKLDGQPVHLEVLLIIPRDEN